jgi:hypothetical protein
MTDVVIFSFHEKVAEFDDDAASHQVRTASASLWVYKSEWVWLAT